MQSYRSQQVTLLSQKEEELVPLLEIKTPAGMFVAYKPLPLLVINETPFFMDLKEIKDNFDFNYCEDIMVTRQFKNQLTASQEERSNIQKIKSYYEESYLFFSNLVVCKINDIVGYGLFTKQEIKPRQLIGLYAGENDLPCDNEDFKYWYSAGDSEEERFASGITSRYYGGLSRFIQHMPPYYGEINLDDDCNDILNTIEEEKKEQEKLPENTVLQRIKNLATANVIAVTNPYGGTYITGIYAYRNILPNEQLGFFYGNLYWEKKDKKPRYFDKEGNVIDLTVSTCEPPPGSKKVAGKTIVP